MNHLNDHFQHFEKNGLTLKRLLYNIDRECLYFYSSSYPIATPEMDIGCTIKEARDFAKSVGVDLNIE